MFRSKSRIILALAALVIVGSLGSIAVAAAMSNGKSDLARVKAAVATYHRTEAAETAGWVLVEGLDHCFDNQPTGGMGIHYINTELLDTNLDVSKPEALVYQHKPNGKLQLGAVEYIVPAEPWDAEGHGGPPELLGHHFHLNENLGVYVLHAWIFKNNPAGMFEDWNPNVSCPD